MDVFSTGIRRFAFEKLAALAVKTPVNGEESDIVRLSQLYQYPTKHHNEFLDNGTKGLAPKSQVPMGIRELDVLISLCKASISVNRLEPASTLVSQLSAYLPESHSQHFHASPFLQSIKPSPWETLTYNLIHALLSLGLNCPSLQETVSNTVNDYLQSCAKAIKSTTPFHRPSYEVDRHGSLQDPSGILAIAVSLVGFFEASAMHATFWDSSEKLQIIEHVRDMLSETFMVDIETASSTIRNANIAEGAFKDWRRYARRYAGHGRPLGAMLLQQGFMRFIKACAASLIGSHHVSEDELLDDFMDGVGIARGNDDSEIPLVRRIAEIATDQIHLLDDGSDYLRLGSPWQQRLTFSVKALCLISFLNCVVLDEDVASSDALLAWLEGTIIDPNQMSCTEIATTTLKSIAIIARLSPSSASSASRSLLRFLVRGGSTTGSIISVAARCLAQVLGILSQDAVITTLYSLGNVLSSRSDTKQLYQNDPTGDTTGPTSNALASYAQPRDASMISLVVNGEDNNVTQRNVIHAIVTIATSCNDDKITALAQSMLLQKIGKINTVVDSYIIQETAALALYNGPAEFQLLLKFYNRACLDAATESQNTISDAVQSAMIYLSLRLKRSSSRYEIYLLHLLETIVNKGNATDREDDRQKEDMLTHGNISPFLRPLALLVSFESEATGTCPMVSDFDDSILAMFRDIWFNIAVHGISLNSAFARSHFEELRIIAEHSPPLVAEDRTEVLESDVELNTILRRGMSPQRLIEQKRTLVAELPSCESDIKRLNYPKVVFLNAALLVEGLRASTGNCTKVLNYFLDPALDTAEMASCMNAIADKAVSRYLAMTLSGKREHFSAPYLSKQLADFLVACCHRIERVQIVARSCANKIITECPSALCQKHSLFSLLELLTVMWSSCLQGELDEFDWKSSITSPRGIVNVDLPDDYGFRKTTLELFHERSRAWVKTVMNFAPLDVKGLLQTYLSEFEDDGAYGHISMGRSFALEMGSLIPQSDQRLGSIESHGGDSINIASGFIAQYTARQKYPYSDMPSTNGLDRDRFGCSYCEPTTQLPESFVGVEKTLSHLYEQAARGGNVSFIDIRDPLRRAAALCSSNTMRPSIIQFLVSLPFEIFTEESIKLGISLWLGVINENPKAEPRILVEVAEAWEKTIQRKRGLFDPSFDYADPMYSKIELLPSDKALLLQKQRAAQDMILPHSHVLQFFESHFSAVRLDNIQNQRLFYRLIRNTTTGLMGTRGHPLAREIHFRVVLFGLKVLRQCTFQTEFSLWKLKDQILSAGLSWFKHSPRWSYGSNRLQIKAEDKILGDVSSALADIANIGSHDRGQCKSIQRKQDLLQVFLENERSRLRVWLLPLEQERKHYPPPVSGGKNFLEEVISLLYLAWTEDPGIAIQLAVRFPSARLRNDVRRLLLNSPEKALDEPSGLEIMFGLALPADVSFQLKYLLYWASINPIEALTYFLPAYGNHPFILQYAMRALESHPIDVRFYFVPQLVQALRYDALGYVERYILETAKLSQLFAHQVIWNMKANSYKDEDAQVPDPLKPTLDRFMETLISSFSNEERDFYEREFSFFNEITGISGKLRPYIKKSKPEKKEKIEEELRKIKVEVGVYLPSNPDGVVVGIDRKSGKPLQSHAKAPYMATFRIQKTRTRWNGRPSSSPGAHTLSQQDMPTDPQPSPAPDPRQETYEVWQSAIFKVGDDCRQDMLALQMIAAFRSIFESVGLDVWVFPYRVTSTAPGCGVIDVLPNSISRDMLGREAVNGLYDYFLSKYGGENSVRFQQARTNFVKSMAAYSVISYLLQFKDRHNGNIMIDDAGHIIHIDFGFCFDIAPGGVRFERAPFKLTSEMVAVMSGTHNAHPHAASSVSGGISLPGGNTHNPTNTQPYRWFESLVVKAFLASRPYCTKLSHIVSLMLDSGLPCFKPDTLRNFRDRFVLDKSEREAAEYMRELIRKSYMNFSTKGYDQFQLLTNGIPY